MLLRLLTEQAVSLLAAGEDVGLATVYRVLTQFETAGLVTRHNFETGHSVFELSKGEHHDHMVCVDCRAVLEFRSEEIEQIQERIVEENGGVVDVHSSPEGTTFALYFPALGDLLKRQAGLLSGGEQALTAMSLLFAVYLVKPSPFCMLDEADAPLDDVNIGRFVNMLREFSRNTSGAGGLSSSTEKP